MSLCQPNLEQNPPGPLFPRGRVAVTLTINWARVESILLSHYTVGSSEEGARAYSPLMLFKCLLLQKWFRIPSDPELENQITDRLSFKTFLGLSFSQPAPDHSTFSRFRSRLPKQAMDAFNSEILRQFEQQGLFRSKRSMPTMATLENPTVIFSPSTTSKMASCARTPPPPS